MNTFLEAQSDLTDGNIKNLIAIGDSMFELDAAHNLAMCFEKALIKTIKFKEFPKPNELVRQLTLVISKFEEIVNGSRNVTIKLEKKQS
jgi:histidinol phosphatase-like enzyme